MKNIVHMGFRDKCKLKILKFENQTTESVSQI